ncbi:MAG: hypothetical protein ACF8NJ_08630, partial [Phycisphaerales bacterium JB038]
MNKRFTLSVLAVLCLVIIGVLLATLKPQTTPRQAEATPGPQAARGTDAGQLTPEQQAELRLALEQASQELNQGNYALAQRLLEDAAAAFPRRQQVYALLHEAHVGQQQWEPAYAAIQEAIN